MREKITFIVAGATFNLIVFLMLWIAAKAYNEPVGDRQLVVWVSMVVSMAYGSIITLWFLVQWRKIK